VVAFWALVVKGAFFSSNCIGQFPGSLTNNGCYGFMTYGGEVVYFGWFRKFEPFGGFSLDAGGCLGVRCWSGIFGVWFSRSR